MNITDEMIEFCKDFSCKEIMEAYDREDDGYNMYQCLHKDEERYSMKYYENTNLMKCFSCGETLDSIGLYGELNGLDSSYDFLEIVEMMWNEFKLYNKTKKEINSYRTNKNKKEIDEELKEIKEIDIKAKKEEVERYLYNTKTVKELRETINAKTGKRRGHFNYGDIALDKRAINLDNIDDILNNNGIEIRHKAYQINKDKPRLTAHEKEMLNLGNNYVNSLFIVANNRTYVLQRTVDDYILPNIRENDKYNHGIVDTIIIKGSENYKNILITEGIYDALSILSNSDNKEQLCIICLNSIENFSKFMNNYKPEFFKDKEIFSCLDNDKAGEECHLKLVDYLKEYKVNRVIKQGFKDLNEYYIHLNTNKKGA